MVFSQRDERWRSIALGGSNVTIGDYGCLLTCYAMVLRYYGWATDPGMLHGLFMKARGFDSNGNYHWDTATNIYGGTQEIVDARNRSLTDAELKKMLDAINKGYPVIIQVDMVPSTTKADMHFVVGYEYRDGEVMIADPWTGKQYSLRSRYGSTWALKRAIYRYIIFKPEPKIVETVEPSVSDTRIKELSDRAQKAEKQAQEWEKKYLAAEDTIQTITSTIQKYAK